MFKRSDFERADKNGETSLSAKTAPFIRFSVIQNQNVVRKH